MNAGQSTFFDANSLVYSYNSWCLGRNRHSRNEGRGYPVHSAGRRRVTKVTGESETGPCFDTNPSCFMM